MGNSATALDPTEGNTTAENAAAFVGQVYGSVGSPLSGQIRQATMVNNGGSGSQLDQNNSVSNDQFTTNLGSGTATYTFDAVVVYNATITYADGTTDTVTANIVQDTAGNLFLAPETSSNSDTGRFEAKPIRSLTLNSVNDSTTTGLTADRQVTGFDDGIISGTAGNDTINGSYAEPIANGSDEVDNNDGGYGGTVGDGDYIEAGAGNDSVSSAAGADIVFGGTGNDTIDGGAANDTLFGGDGDDRFVLTGTFGNDTITGGEGVETTGDRVDLSAITTGVTVTLGALDTGTLTSGANSITLAEVEAFVLTGQADTFNGAATIAAHSVDGGAGNDTLTGGAGNDSLVGGSGNDQLTGGAGNDALFGGDGDDRFVLGDGFGTDTISGGENSETTGDRIDLSGLTSGVSVTLSASETGALTSGTNSATFSQVETFTLTAQNDTFNGALATTTISLDGGAGDDVLTGGSGADNLIGGAGNDILNGGAGSDTLSGGDGDDTFVLNAGSFGSDTVIGGEGAETVGDRIDFSAHTSGVTVNFSANETGTAGNGISSLSFSQIERFTLTAQNDVYNAGALSAGQSVEGLAGNDSLTGGSGQDRLYGGTGVDTLIGNDGADTLDGGDGNDFLFGGIGDDTLAGGAGADSLNGGSWNDVVDYSASNAAVSVNLATGTGVGGHAEGDTYGGIDGIIGSAFNDTLIGFDGSSLNPSDTYTNVIQGGAGNDYIDGMAGNDFLFGGADNDTVLGGAGDDSVSGDAGNDILFGGVGNDQVFGGTGNDQLFGGDGNDTLSGGEGDDTLTGGVGADTFFGGTGTDNFVVGIGDTVDGGESGGDGDTINLTGQGPLRIVYSSPNQENGTVQFLNALGVVIGTLNFNNIENIIPCFTPGTLIDTDRGSVAVETLQAGDMVITRDGAAKPIRWIGTKQISSHGLRADPALQPVQIRAGALGGGLPLRDMRVSPQHRMLITGVRAELLFGEDEVLVSALHLVGSPGIDRLTCLTVTYVHLLFDQHEIIRADGSWTESLQPGERALAGIGQDGCAELFSIFPELAQAAGRESYAAARLSLKGYEARALLSA